MKEFILWNPDKVAEYDKIDVQHQNVRTLLNHSNKTGQGTWSTFMAVSKEHAHEICTAIYNETDVKLQCEEVPTDIRLSLYRADEYNSWESALADAAVYDAGINLSHRDLHNTKLVNTLLHLLHTAAECVDDNQTRFRVALHRQNEQTLYGYLDEYI